LPVLPLDAYRLTRSKDTRRTVDEFAPVRTITQGPAPLRLSRSAVRDVSMSIGREPLLLKAQLTTEQVGAIAAEWDAFVDSGPDSATYQTNGNGMQTLRKVWTSNMRVETQLRDDDTSNPVLEWMAGAPPSSFAAQFYRLQGQLVELVERDHEVLKTPSFVNGFTQPGGGGVTHYDEYTNLATVVLGSKTFFVAPPPAFIDAEAHGQANERLGVDPLSRDSPSPDAWRVAVMEPGDVLLLPTGWWHYVKSEQRSVMTNVWF